MKEHDIFDRLFAIIGDRKGRSPDESYVASLMHRGAEKINSKIMEEAEEVCEAALEEDRSPLLYELCDLLFHAFVLAGYSDISIDEIRAEFERRFGTSGLQEKAGRKK